MKITANRKNDIMRQREEYDAEIQKLQDVYDAQYDTYKTSMRAAKKDLEKVIADMIGPTSLNLEIRCQQGWSTFEGDDLTWEVDVRANDRNKFDDQVALAWNWNVKFDKDGNPVKDSGSWSGLKATTAEQISDLEESVRVLKILNGADWSAILTSPMPKIADYVDKENSREINKLRKDRPDYESELLDAELESLLGGNTAIRLYQDQYYSGSVCILPVAVTDKFVKGYIFPEYRIKGSGEGEHRTADQIRQSTEIRRTAKSNLVTISKAEYDTIEVPN